MLQGAGAALALPLLEAMTPSAVAAGAGRPPLRMVIFTVTGGTVIESWKPQNAGPLNRLPSILRPLEPYKNDLLIVSGLSHHGRSSGLNAHEHCALMHLTGAPQVSKENGRLVGGISVDQKAAQVVGSQTYLPSMEIGYGNHETRYSFRSPRNVVPAEGHPRLVFDRMFRGRQPIIPNWTRRAANQARQTQRTARPDSLEQSVLDLVQEDARSLRSRVGVNDRRTLDQYLDSVRSVERRMEFLEREASTMAADGIGGTPAPIPDNLPSATIPSYRITNPIEQDPEPHGEYIDLMSDLLLLALRTDTTRVITLGVGSDGARFPGVVTVGFERHAHTLEHHGNSRRPEDADPVAREGCRQIHAWYTTHFARLVGKMKQAQEGDTTLLDNSLLLYTSYMADGGHGRQDYPALLAGNAQGTLRTGRHLAFPTGTPMSNLYVEMLHRMGVRVAEFGESRTSPAAAYNGRLPGLQ